MGEEKRRTKRVCRKMEKSMKSGSQRSEREGVSDQVLSTLLGQKAQQPWAWEWAQRATDLVAPSGLSVTPSWGPYFGSAAAPMPAHPRIEMSFNASIAQLGRAVFFPDNGLHTEEGARQLDLST